MINGPTLVALYDADAKTAFPWMSEGQRWRGVRVVSFDTQAERVLVEGQDGLRVLALFRGLAGKRLLLPDVEDGVVTLADGTKVYGKDCTIIVGPARISSPNGVMVSNLSSQVIKGDLAVSTGEMTCLTSKATVRVLNKKVTVEAETLEVLPDRKRPNKSLQPTPTVVTPPAAQETVPPVGVAEH
jgi:hypothetical protein